MNEVEVKAKVENLGQVREKLVQLGCQFSPPIRQEDKIFIHESINFSDLDEGTIVLRIRRSKNILLTLKKKLGNELAHIEREIQIDKAEEAEEMLELMSFKEVVNVNKTRSEAKYQGMTICLDSVDTLGNFIEVEKITDKNNIDEIQEELYKFLEGIGIGKEKIVLYAYDTLIYNNK